mmetsp:Transcript_30200/g.48037  ORF Transcript_30200/g.48037 Transcript_30200/m.48037 type:complete len:548 (+) Transcript_30200:499-2142(+)
MAPTPAVVHWFRKGLRVHDNPALLSALEYVREYNRRDKENVMLFRPVFVLDPWFLANGKVGANRWRFLQQTLVDLDGTLRKMGSRLYVMRGRPTDVFKGLFDKYDVKQITWEIDIEPYARERDCLVADLARNHGVQVVTATGHTMYDPEKIFEANGNKIPLTYQKFTKILSKIGKPSLPVSSETLMSDSQTLEALKRGNLTMIELPKVSTCYDPPTLEELIGEQACKEIKPCLFPGGEQEGLRRLDEHICDKKRHWVKSFEKPKTSPNSLEPSTTVLSPYLKFGCVSARKMYWQIEDVLSAVSGRSLPPVSLHGQLLWREFFYTVATFTKNFDKMEGNTLCRQIPWGNDDQLLAAWAEAKTGFPYIDAIMTQLRNEGWVHHLARHSVACFLTRGDLWQSWEKGKDVFEELLLDADWALNSGNWMWLSASAFFHQYFRVYSPVVFGKKTDPAGNFIRKYVPKLKNYPDKYIYEPWTAPLSVQKEAGCVIGVDYPKPIVDHALVSKENISKMKYAYTGNSPVKPQRKSKTPPKESILAFVSKVPKRRKK